VEIVVDVDCLVAGILTDTGASSELIELWRDGIVEVVVSPRLLDELRATLAKPRIVRRYPDAPRYAEAFSAELDAYALVIDDPADETRYVPRDPGDDYLPALALAAGAECLVTRDKHFDGVKIPGLRILTPGRLVRELRSPT
jgi:putative PIN family toxin of toxin-antitoxin system